MGEKLFAIAIVGTLMWLSYCAGSWVESWEGPVTCESAQSEIERHLYRMQNPAQLGCKMKASDFGEYHHFKRIVGACQDARHAAQHEQEQ